MRTRATRCRMLVKSDASGDFTIPARSGLRSTYTMQAKVAAESRRATPVNRFSQKFPVQPSSAFARREISCFTSLSSQLGEDRRDRCWSSHFALPGRPNGRTGTFLPYPPSTPTAPGTSQLTAVKPAGPPRDAPDFRNRIQDPAAWSSGRALKGERGSTNPHAAESTKSGQRLATRPVLRRFASTARAVIRPRPVPRIWRPVSIVENRREVV